MNFELALEVGKAGESAIARWLRARGWAVVPVYEKIIDEGKGPQVYLPRGELIAPDLLAFRSERARWIEAKHKSAFSWHRKTQRWVTGIDLRHYRDYCQVDDATPWPVWLMFLHRGGQAKDSPPNSPSGLFGNRLSVLRCSESHRSPKFGRSGGVFWTLETLHKLAELKDVITVASAEAANGEAIVPLRKRGDGQLMWPFELSV